MIHDFYIGHRIKPHVFEPTDHAAVWSTCLRSLAFVSRPETLTPDFKDEFYGQHKAYQFLLEIICGLHSPILGETEVFGQFKNFAQEWIRYEPKRTALAQKLLGDAKDLRSRYLRNLGTQSYGSWIRRNLQAGAIDVLGAGHLVQEILPYLEKQGSAVTLHVRDPKRVTFRQEGVQQLVSGGLSGEILIIAAPMDNRDIEQCIGARQPLQIFDLRDTSTSDPLSAGAGMELYRLHDIFSEIQHTKVRLLPLVAQVKQEIAELSEKLVSHALVRPQGWDDLCA
jgi:glutamyl-tRNA reductase